MAWQVPMEPLDAHRVCLPDWTWEAFNAAPWVRPMGRPSNVISAAAGMVVISIAPYGSLSSIFKVVVLPFQMFTREWNSMLSWRLIERSSRPEGVSMVKGLLPWYWSAKKISAPDGRVLTSSLPVPPRSGFPTEGSKAVRSEEHTSELQ